MNKRLKQWLQGISLILLAWVVSPVWAGDWLPKPVKISAHSWAWVGPYEGPSQANRGYRMNLGLVVGKQAVAVIDSGYTQEMAEAMLRRIREITPLPVRYVVNTNSQPHRFMGNDIFRKAGAEIIAGREAAERMENEGAAFAGAVARNLGMKEGTVQLPQAPGRLLEKGQNLTLDLGGVTLRISEMGRTHTRGSLIVEVMQDRTVFSGDILYSGRLLSVMPDSHVTQWIAAYDQLRGLKAQRFVPGHGQVAALSAFEHHPYRYLVELKKHMELAVKAGTDADTAVKSFNSKPWSKLANFEELAGRNASLSYLEAESEGF